jgi:hypothetical protein
MRHSSWTDRHWGRSPPNTYVSPAKNPADCSTVITIHHPVLVQGSQWARSSITVQARREQPEGPQNRDKNSVRISSSAMGRQSRVVRMSFHLKPDASQLGQNQKVTVAAGGQYGTAHRRAKIRIDQCFSNRVPRNLEVREVPRKSCEKAKMTLSDQQCSRRGYVFLC